LIIATPVEPLRRTLESAQYTSEQFQKLMADHGADDVEGLDWVRIQENRDKSDRWFRGDVLPSIDEHGRAVLIGDWLHTDGLIARLKNTGMFTVLEFPLLCEGDGKDIERCTWKAKYPTQEAIDLKRQELGDSGFRRRL
jgi:hypothetical protein